MLRRLIASSSLSVVTWCVWCLGMADVVVVTVAIGGCGGGGKSDQLIEDWDQRKKGKLQYELS